MKISPKEIGSLWYVWNKDDSWAGNFEGFTPGFESYIVHLPDMTPLVFLGPHFSFEGSEHPHAKFLSPRGEVCVDDYNMKFIRRVGPRWRFRVKK